MNSQILKVPKDEHSTISGKHVPVLRHSFCKNAEYSARVPLFATYDHCLYSICCAPLLSNSSFSQRRWYYKGTGIKSSVSMCQSTHIWKQNWYLQTSLILACTVSAFSKHTENFAFRHAIVNFDKYGCLIQYPSDIGKKNQYMLKHMRIGLHISV